MSNSLKPTSQQKTADKGRLERLSYMVSNRIGIFFYKLGFNVAENPKATISLAFLGVLICCIGFVNFKQERDPLKLWVPKNSKFLLDTKFIINKFGEGVRTQNVLLTSKENVLTPEIMVKLGIINKEIEDIEASDEKGEKINFQDICFKIPLIAAFTVEPDSNDEDNLIRRKRADFDDSFFGNDEDSESALKKILGPYMNFNMKEYCKLVESLPLGCMRDNFLELWKSNYKKIGNLTKSEILSKLNQTEVSPETGHEARFVSLLGGVERNSEGYIISAKSLLTSWHVRINFSDVDSTKLGNMAGTEEWATFESMAFEEQFLIKMERLRKELENDDLKIYYSAARSYGDISSKTLFQDIDKLCLGVILMMIYMILVLSRYSWTELRFQLTMVGLLNVGMAYVSGCGLSSIFFSYSPVHTSLFFIIMGLGVDDIFVIMSALRKVKSESKDLRLSQKIGKTLEKAGASITITSLTDIIAFFVGGSTVLPSLQSFCIFAALCILMTYLFVVTFFIAFLTLDEKRLAKQKNGCCPCITHTESKLWCEPQLMPRFIDFIYSKIILNKVGKASVIFLAIAISGFSAERVFHIKQKFDPMWFIPAHMQFHKYVMTHRELYPERGFEAGIYMGSLNYTAEMPKIISLAETLKNQTHILSRVSSWTDPFKEFVEEFHKIDITRDQLTDAQFKLYISKFLFSSMGGQFQANFKFKEPLVCGEPASDIKISSISFNFHKFDDRDEYLPAKKAVEKIIEDAHFNTGDNVFLWGKIFGNWITDEIIDEEIFRNITLALIGVFFCTAVMIVNLQVCIYIFLCVLMSLVSVGGFMQVWGLTLDLVTCISLQLSVGLCIDCAAHIGHTFLTISQETGDIRALQTVQIIGAAVWQGGGSTLLAVSLLAFSDAYTYRTFFKVFTIVIVFGLFYGTFFLPVILSIFNPKPYELNQACKQMGEESELVVIARAEANALIKKNDKMTNCDNLESEKLNQAT